ncbi:selenide, water dikinase SelD [Falsiroseomonas sp. E2-1-a4]|uniref:selenide, water dikinase SelD n=1 Tax=Falsiroseomonas sp. E2-1-a4 TaxID=3239299 RepID=UPI003F3D606B
MRNDGPVDRELVLLGAGHAHLGVLRHLAGHPPPAGTRVTLVAREAEALYSGMLPGLIAGRFHPRDCILDLPRLARAAGARFLRAEATGLDLAVGRIMVAGDRPPLRFDLLSLNSGAAPALAPGAAEHALLLRPFDSFLAGWDRLLARAARRPLRLLVVGAGAAGLEVALALRHRLGAAAHIGLVGRGTAPLPGMAPAAGRAATAALAAGQVAWHGHADVVRVAPDALWLADGRALPCEAAIWAAGAAAPAWLDGSGLARCPRGFIAVDAALRSLSHPRVFAAGDIASVLPHPRPRAGVFAVRQGAPLAANLHRVLAGRAPRPFRPQRRYLALVSTGDAAIASWGGQAAAGRWVLRLKDAIDRRWIGMQDRMPAMPKPGRPAPETMRCGGCGAKLAAPVLARVLAALPQAEASPDIVAGLEAPDDAALLRLPSTPNRLLVQTVDMFRAPDADPFLFGRIAATHALGDIAAMGAEPRAALAIAALPPAAEAVQEADLLAMLRGGQMVLEAEGARLVGGHTAEAAEAMLGFAITGEVAAEAPLRRGGLRAGDVLLLTKPLGTGTLLAAAMAGAARADWVEAALRQMQVSPFPAARLLTAHGATACADVTGFGLLGHLLEMLRASGVAARLDPDAVPALEGAEAMLAAGHLSTLDPGNRAAALPHLVGITPRLALLLDPQTAGGLLAGVPAARAGACLAALRAVGCTAAAIGLVEDGTPQIALEPGCMNGVSPA